MIHKAPQFDIFLPNMSAEKKIKIKFQIHQTAKTFYKWPIETAVLFYKSMESNYSILGTFKPGTWESMVITSNDIIAGNSRERFMIKLQLILLASKASRKVANLTERKNLHTQ